MGICANCGSQINQEDIFCKNCGMRLEKTSSNELKISSTSKKQNNNNNIQDKTTIEIGEEKGFLNNTQKISPENSTTFLTESSHNYKSNIILKTSFFFLLAFTLDALITGLNWVIYENSKIQIVNFIQNGSSVNTTKYGTIEWGLGYTLIILFSMAIGMLQAFIYNYEFAGNIQHYTKIERIIYIFSPLLHMGILIYFLYLITNNVDLYYVVNVLVSLEILVGIVHLLRRATKLNSQFNSDRLNATVSDQAISDFEKREKENKKRNKSDTKFLLNYFEFLGGGKHG